MDFAVLLLFSTPLILAGLGEAVGQRSGVLNIGLEGMMLVGAFVGFVVADRSGSLWLGFGAAAASGVVLTALAAFFSVRMGADQVVVGTAINLLALGATGLAFRRLYGQSGQLLSSSALPKWAGFDPVMIAALILVPAVWYLLHRTNWGLAVRACGEYPAAVEASGFPVSKLRLQASMVGGILAALGGAYLSLGVAGTFAEAMTAGRGFLAIALVTFGRWQPVWVALAAFLLGYLQSLQYSLQGRAILGVSIPSQLWLALPYVMALVVLVLVGTGTVTPQALGKPYTKER
ncbi:MAG: ABC transporter permease [Fimbriimonadales bacterium]